jgi:hypothetical protein
MVPAGTFEKVTAEESSERMSEMLPAPPTYKARAGIAKSESAAVTATAFVAGAVNLESNGIYSS